MKYSIEGEGPNIGRRTVFFDYPGELDIIDQAGALYCRVQELDDKLIRFFYMYRTREIYIETTNAELPLLDRNWKIIYNTHALIPHKFLRHVAIIKIEVPTIELMEERIEVSDYYVDLTDEVWLMPTFEITGEQFMKYVNYINPKVRYMPPVQNLLHIP